MFGEVYEATRRELAGFLRDADATGDEPVPACPGWTTADVVRHLTGLADDYLTGNLEVYASPEWTSAQVARFADLDLAGIIDAWAERGPAFARILDDIGSADHVPEQITTVVGRFPSGTFPPGVCVDANQHVADVAAALDAEVPIPDDRMDLMSKQMLGNIGLLWPMLEGPRLTVRTPGLERTLEGAGDGVTLQASSLDLFRSLGGRRTADQILALDWTGAADDVATAATNLVVPFFQAPVEPVE